MSGHSKWSTIKHKKARSDEKKGKEFTKIAKDITIAVRTGNSGDPESNAKLKLAIQKGKAINMPNENIARAIKKGTGDIEGDVYEEIIYEGYAPGGIAVLLEIATDNRNRTASEIRHLFAKNNGNLGETGCVGWMFKRVGVIVVNKEKISLDEDEFMLQALEAGADDVKSEEDVYEIITAPELLMEVKEALEAEKIEVEMVDLIMMPDTEIDVNDEATAIKVLKLIELLEDHDDVQSVYANANIPDELLDRLDQ